MCSISKVTFSAFAGMWKFLDTGKASRVPLSAIPREITSFSKKCCSIFCFFFFFVKGKRIHLVLYFEIKDEFKK